ncbi:MULTISPECIES: hypothetical protein [unclassified Acinetobacter]|uniref:hypothetical protein n=1 Tax=unclassified Acinetobacter TaxID=196816 RepID=UPI002575D461|nr:MULTISPECIES: hypothetical protein [unclassified Acinetobacter]MDM1766082.1 hypothetical protein [Acinetobacter sp. 226-1]MDM1769852.1 hypothetical protein [Acinetobacter sp. 226-4]
MTTINNYESLIKKVGGIEKAKAIVEQYKDLETCFKSYRYFDVEKDDFLRKPKPGRVDVINLRTAIASHDKDHCEHEWNDLTSNGDKYRFLVCKHCDSTQNYLPLDESREFNVGDLVVKTHPKNTILWPVLGVYKNGGVWLDYKGFCWKPPRVRHATPSEIKAGRRLDHSEDVTDMVTDITNHISPNTKVVEL